MNLYNLKVALYDAKCQVFRFARSCFNWVHDENRERQYLFILCAPYSGSTLLHELMSSSLAVSPNNIFGTREGMSLPNVRNLVDYQQEWNSNYHYPWPAIKQRWMQYWDHSKSILLDKSPAAILRADAIEKAFQPIHFLALVRNPYAQIESLMRRNKLTIEEAMAFYLRLLYVQKQNLDTCERILLVRYEDLVNTPAATCSSVEAFFPQVGSLYYQQTFKAHNQLGTPQKLIDFNEISIKRLTSEQLHQMNITLREHQDILSYFGYFLHTR